MLEHAQQQKKNKNELKYLINNNQQNIGIVQHKRKILLYSEHVCKF